MTREPEHVEVDSPAVRVVTLFYGVVSLAMGLWIALAPLTVLLDRFVPDDAFYYFNTARNFAATGSSSFDQIHFTNGYHPLWFLVSVPVFVVFPDGGETPIRVMFVLQAIFGAVAAALMAREVARWFGPALAAVTGLLWIVVMHRVLVNGLESALDTALFAVVFVLFLRYVRERRGAVALGVASGLLFLARTDAWFLVVLLALWIMRASRAGLKARLPSAVSDLVRFAAPAFLIAGLYLTMNVLLTGHVMPVSGAAKIYHSDVARAAAMAARHESSFEIALWNLWWPVRQHAWWAVVSLCAPIAFVVLTRLPKVDRTEPAIALTLQTWPFAVALWCVFLFYGVAFFGDHSAMLWYYPTLVLAAWFYLSAAIVVFTRWAGRACPAPTTVAWLAIGLTLGWIGVVMSAIGAVGAVAAASVGRRLGQRARAIAMIAVLIAAIALVTMIASRRISLSTWAIVTTVTAIAGGAIVVSRPRHTLALVMAGIVAPTLVVHGVNVSRDLRTPPSHWNYHLYLGAEWARDHLPASATIWSGSAGILGYFSGHRTVNTDGLANDYDFLEHVLKAGKVGTYIQQWDYAIDAMDTDLLAKYFPAGCFVPLPAEVVAPEFEDGGVRRKLRVFQMKTAGIAECR